MGEGSFALGNRAGRRYNYGMKSLLMVLLLLPAAAALAGPETRVISLQPIVDQLGLKDLDSDMVVLVSEDDVRNSFRPDPNHIPIQVNRKMGLQPYEHAASNTYGNLVAIAFNPSVGDKSLNLKERVVLIRVDNGKPEILRLLPALNPKYKGGKASINGLHFVTPSVVRIERIRSVGEHDFERTYEFYDVIQHKSLSLGNLPIRQLPGQMQLTLSRDGQTTKKIYAPTEGTKITGDVRALANRFYSTVESTPQGKQVVYYQLDPASFELTRVANVLFEDGAVWNLYHNIVDERAVFAKGQDGLRIAFSQQVNGRWKELALEVSPQKLTLTPDHQDSGLRPVQGRPDLVIRTNGHSVELVQGNDVLQSWASPKLDYGTAIGSNEAGLVFRVANHPNYRFFHLRYDGSFEQLTPEKYRLIQVEADGQTLRGLSTWTPEYDFSFFIASITPDGRIPEAPENLRFSGPLGGPEETRYPLVDKLEVPTGNVTREVHILRKDRNHVFVYDPQAPELGAAIFVRSGPLNVFYDDAGKLVLWNAETHDRKIVEFGTWKFLSGSYEDVECRVNFGGAENL